MKKPINPRPLWEMKYFIYFNGLSESDLEYLSDQSCHPLEVIQEAICDGYIGIILPLSKMVRDSDQLDYYHKVNKDIQIIPIELLKLDNLVGLST